ncbi:MAG: hypothetical protein ACOY4R_03295 [Pseudomonadota bacterium]
MPLSSNQIEDLQAFAGTIIPASADHGVPGADDGPIFTEILRSLGRDEDDVAAALTRLAVLAGGRFAALAPQRRLDIANLFRAEGGPALAAISRVVLLCYYRDDRVMRSLGQEPRPPFPKGHVVEQGDWSLLDPVRQRKPFYRTVR